ncbi:MAG: hypothetical protein MRY63_07820 [Neomegalonema sp.]|nr:hypothetical protein [Neomegalonema sp.]
MLTVAEAGKLIESGAVLLVAGSQEAMAQLPKGRWIGGTAVYFLTEEGGMVDRERVFCTHIERATDAKTVVLPAAEIGKLAADRFSHGFTGILIPGFSSAHTEFALKAAEIEGVFDQPLLGWIAGVHLTEIGSTKPQVFDGSTGIAHEDGAALLHVELPADADIDFDIVNLFEQGDAAGQTFVFDESGFSAKTARVNGESVDLARYYNENGFDTRWPLVANYAGAMVNVSVNAVNADSGEVTFYAPVIAGVEYRIAKPVENYVASFAEKAGTGGAEAFSCNCILNYLYGELEGKHTGDFTGPATFGEIAYMLLNQTMVRFSVKAAEQAAAA